MWLVGRIWGTHNSCDKERKFQRQAMKVVFIERFSKMQENSMFQNFQYLQLKNLFDMKYWKIQHHLLINVNKWWKFRWNLRIVRTDSFWIWLEWPNWNYHGRNIRQTEQAIKVTKNIKKIKKSVLNCDVMYNFLGCKCWTV